MGTDAEGTIIPGEEKSQATIQTTASPTAAAGNGDPVPAKGALAAESTRTVPSTDLENGIRDADAVNGDQNALVGEDGQAEDPDLVTYDGEDDPTDPHNWPLYQKWVITLLMSNGGLVTLMSGTMMAPALASIGDDLRLSDEATQMTMSIFVLSFAFGPIILAPLSEVFGRRPVWLISGCNYILWNTLCGFAKSNAVMIVGRLMAGIGASAEFAITSPVLSDCWRPHQRGRSFAIATFLPLLGPAIGPIIGGVITQTVGWRWLFWTLSIFDAILVISGTLIFPETSAQAILRRKARALSRLNPSRNYHTEYDALNQSLSSRLLASLTRPTRLLISQPIIQLMSLFLAYNFGVLYIVISTFATLWTTRYGQSVAVSGLHYIALAVGYTIAAQLGAPATDAIWARLRARADGATAPEYRVPLMIPGAVLIPAGLIWYGWAAAARCPWIVPDMGVAVFGCGIILGTQAMQAYVMDAFPKYVASASAASQLLRSVAGFAFPIFAPALYARLGWGWGNSLLAILFVTIGVPAPLILWRFGPRLRAMGKPLW